MFDAHLCFRIGNNHIKQTNLFRLLKLKQHTMKQIFFIFMSVILFSSCIGTDLIDEIEVPAQVLISTNTASIKVGDELQFNAVFNNKYGITEDKPIVWSTTTPEYISVTASGLVKALKQGDATLTATAEDATASRILKITSDTVQDTTISAITTRTGTFKGAGAGSYTVSGDVVVSTSNGKSTIMVKDNFKSSAGPSLYLLLTNHTNGSYSVVNGNPIVNGISAQITPARLTVFQGARTWDIPEGIDVGNYKYALLYCTLGPVFGYAELK
jgi:hypothetical protein